MTYPSFLVVALQFIRPRSNFDAKPAITTLYNYQKTLLWWILREANNAPTRERFLNSTNETLQFAGRKLGVAKSRKVKAYLGRLELAQLIDFDTMQSPFLPVAEMHHLAWTLGCICGVRPGSLAYSHHRENDFLKWKDVSLTRGQEKGAFSVKVTFWHLKGNQNQLGEARPLEFYINSPTQVDHIAMSPAHRFIVMLLRRKGLADYSSLNELLNGQHKAIRITDSLLEQPVLLAAGPRGLSVTEKPASASSLTEYMGNRAMKAGYQRGITMYAWRRKAATELRRAIGLDGARAFMGHRPGTTTLMDKYEQGNFDLPVFEIAMRLDTRASIATMDEDASPALTRLIDRTRLEGIFLQRTIDRLASESEDLQSAIREKNYAAERNARRRIKKFATQVLHDESKRLAERTLTVEAFNQRKAELQEPMALSSIIDKRVQQLMATSRSEPSTCSTTRESSGVEESENADLRFDDIRDAEDDLDLANQQALVEAEVDPEGSHSDEAKQALDPESNFLEHVRVFMECAGQEKFVMEAEGHLRCSLCLEDDTITLANKVPLI